MKHNLGTEGANADYAAHDVEDWKQPQKKSEGYCWAKPVKFHGLGGPADFPEPTAVGKEHSALLEGAEGNVLKGIVTTRVNIPSLLARPIKHPRDKCGAFENAS